MTDGIVTGRFGGSDACSDGGIRSDRLIKAYGRKEGNTVFLSCAFFF